MSRVRTRQPTRLRSGRGSLSSTPPVPTVTVVTSGYDQATVSYRVLLPGPLQSGQNYHLIRTSTTTAKLATTWANKNAGTAIDLTDSSAQVTQGYTGVEFDTSIDGSTWIARAGTSYTYTGLNPQTTVYGRARTVDGTTFSAYGTANATTATATPDVTAPSVPVGTIGTVTSTTVNLSWTTPVDAVVPGAITSGWASTKIRRDGVALPVVNAPATTVQDLGLNPATLYSYTWAALDAAGNESAQSAAKSATTTAAGSNVWLAHSPKLAGGVEFLPIFPGIVGDGTNSVGGTGRVSSVLGGNNAGATLNVVLVNTLTPNQALAQVAQSGGTTIYRGGLRSAATLSGPRSVLFEISGVSNWSTLGGGATVLMSNPNITIYGHTAPGTGHYMRGGNFYLNGSHQSIEGMHILMGDDAQGMTPSARGAINCQGSTGTITGIVLDRCSFYWGMDETVDIFTGVDEFTMSHCIVAEGLNNPPLYPQPTASGFGQIIYGFAAGRGKTIRANLYTQNYARNPNSYCPYARIDNNVINNWGDTAINLGDSGTVWPVYYAAVRNNVAILGNFTPKVHAKYLNFWSTFPAGGAIATPGGAGVDLKFYLSGNALLSAYTASPTPLANQWDVTWDNVNRETGYKVLTNPLSDIGMALLGTGPTLEAVLQSAGAYAKTRDVKDTNVVNQVRTNTGNLQSSVAAYGGWPTPTQATIDHLANGMPTGATARAMNTVDPKYGGQGRTNLEVYALTVGRDLKAVY